MSLDTISLETSGKGDKTTQESAIVELKKLEDIQQYIQTLSDRDQQNKLNNPQLKKDIGEFINKAVNKNLPAQMNEFNSNTFDTDGEAGLDSFEFEKFSLALQKAVEQIILLDGMGKFDTIHQESSSTDGWTNFDKKLAKKGDPGKTILGADAGSSLTEEALKKFGNKSPEELHDMSERPFSLSKNSMEELSILLAKELGSGVESMIDFLTDIPNGVILLPRYLAYRGMINFGDITEQTEGTIKKDELVNEHTSLSIVELLGEKGIEMVQKLAEMMHSGKQGDIAALIVTIASLVAGGAGVVKLGANMARRSAVRTAREAGRTGRTIEGRALRNGMGDIAKSAGKIEKTAGSIDNMLSGMPIINTVGKGVQKMTPLIMSLPANDTIMNLGTNTDEFRMTGTDHLPIQTANSNTMPKLSIVQNAQSENTPEITDIIGPNAVIADTKQKVNTITESANDDNFDIRANKAIDLPKAIKLNEDIRAEALSRGVDVDIIRKERLMQVEGLTGEQADAVIRAHYIQKPGESLGNYGQESLSEKIRIMEAAGVDYRKMLQMGYAGELPTIDPVKLQNARKLMNDDFDDFIDNLERTAPDTETILALIEHYAESPRGKSWNSEDYSKFFTDTLEIELDGKNIGELTALVEGQKMGEKIRDIGQMGYDDALVFIRTEFTRSKDPKILENYFRDANPTDVTNFLKNLESDDGLIAAIMGDPTSTKLLIDTLEKNPKEHAQLIINLLKTDSYIDTLTTNNLSGLRTLLSHLRTNGGVFGDLGPRLDARLASRLNPDDIYMKIDEFLKNYDPDSPILKQLGIEGHPIRKQWNTEFFMATNDGDTAIILNMIKKGGLESLSKSNIREFITSLRFGDKKANKALIDEHIIPENGRFHALMEHERFKPFILDHYATLYL